MRSSTAPRIEHDATVRVGAGGAHWTARTVNISVGGMFVATDTPLEPGTRAQLSVNLHDGATPVDAAGEVVWSRDGGMAIRFVDIDQIGKNRINRLVQRRRDASGVNRRDVRLRLAALPAPLRATAREVSDTGVMLEAELPWLKLGGAVTTEADAEVRTGVVRWVGLDVTRAGSARLRIFVDTTGASEDSREDQAQPPLVAEPFPAARETAPQGGAWKWLVGAGAGALLAAGGFMAFRPAAPQPVLLPPSSVEREPPRQSVPKTVSVPKASDEAQAAAPKASGGAQAGPKASDGAQAAPKVVKAAAPTKATPAVKRVRAKRPGRGRR